MPATHERIVCESLHAGFDVVCEKPMARTMREAGAMAHAAAETGKALSIGFNMRHMGSARVIKQAVDEGVIGRPLAIRAFMLDPTTPWWGQHYVKAVNGWVSSPTDGERFDWPDFPSQGSREQPERGSRSQLRRRGHRLVTCASGRRELADARRVLESGSR
jgi:hypothetical protein